MDPNSNHNIVVPYLSSLVITFLFIIILTLMRRMLNKPSPNTPNLPPGPPKFPIIGNLHLFIGKLPHHYLTDLAKKYGPVMHLQLGQVPTIIFSSAETAKAVFKTHDLIFASRPLFPSLKLLTYNYTDLGLAPYGDYQRQAKKICTTALLSAKRVQSFRPIREEEVANLINEISSNAGLVINLTEMLSSTSLSIISRATIGEKSRHHEEFNKLVPHIIELFGGLSLVDSFPSFKLLHLLHAMSPKSKKLHQKADKILDSIVVEHKAKMAKGGLTETDDILNVLLDLQDRGELEVPLTTENIKAIIMEMFVAGSETSVVTIEWAMSELMNNQRVMKKAQAEVRRVFTNNNKLFGSSDELAAELTYLNLVIKETLRLHPPGPLLSPRESSERCEINGYEIPAKSRVIVNAWAIGRDPNYWTEPETFIPERFLDSKIDYKGNNFEYIPFGAGRRMCVGISFASPVVLLQLASLLYHFDWKLPDGQNKSLDMTQVFRAVCKRKHNLCLVPIPYSPM